MRCVAVVLACLFACGGSSSGTGGPDATTGGPDSGSGTGSGSGSGSGSGGEFACKNKATPPGNGHHNTGQDCMNSCHNHGFTLAGTMYSSATGGTAVSGATITVKDASGRMFDIVTQTDGNFYTSNSVQFPITLYASECQLSQTSQPMMMAVQSNQAGCNESGCHTTNAQGHIHLP